MIEHFGVRQNANFFEVRRQRAISGWMPADTKLAFLKDTFLSYLLYVFEWSGQSKIMLEYVRILDFESICRDQRPRMPQFCMFFSEDPGQKVQNGST